MKIKFKHDFLLRYVYVNLWWLKLIACSFPVHLVLKMTAFSDATPCSLLDMYRSRPLQIRTREQASLRCNGFIENPMHFFTACVGKSTFVLLTVLFLPWALRLATVFAGARGSYYRFGVSSMSSSSPPPDIPCDVEDL
jgi:hypothetical protein